MYNNDSYIGFQNNFLVPKLSVFTERALKYGNSYLTS